MQSAPLPTRNPAEVHKQRRFGVGGCLLIIAGLIALMALVGSIGFIVWSRAASQRVEDQLAVVRAAGHPTTPEELEAYYEYPPEDEDVTPLILAAIQKLDTPEFEAAAEGLPLVGSGEEIPPPGQPWEERHAARVLLERYSEPLQMLHEAADKGGRARFPVRFEHGLWMLLEHAPQLRTAAKLLELETHVRARDGDAQGAAASIRTLLSLARSLENEPVILTQMVRYSCHGMAHRLIDKLLPYADFADEDLEILQYELRRGNFAESLRRALVGERVVGIHTIGHPEKSSDADGTKGSARLGTNEDFALYLATMSRYIDAVGHPWPEALKRAEQVEQDFQATSGKSPVNQLRYMMSNLNLAASPMAITAGARTAAERGLIDTAIAVERYRREAGQPPQGIEDLVPQYLPAVPSDPFDGHPLRYVLEDDEIVIYSIGQDDTDDGGNGDLSGDPDIVVRLPR